MLDEREHTITSEEIIRIAGMKADLATRKDLTPEQRDFLFEVNPGMADFRGLEPTQQGARREITATGQIIDFIENNTKSNGMVAQGTKREVYGGYTIDFVEQ